MIGEREKIVNVSPQSTQGTQRKNGNLGIKKSGIKVFS
jgi:hypothetical protein